MHNFRKGMVSCIIPVFNREMLIIDAINSVLNQSYDLIEIIVVDDGSTDNTLNTLNKLYQKHSNIIKILTIENSGPGAARDYGLKYATGEFIHFLDSDDTIEKDKYLFCLDEMKRHSELNNIPIQRMISYDITYVYNINKPKDYRIVNRTSEKVDNIIPSFIIKRAWSTATPIFHVSLINQTGGIRHWDCEEDLEFEIRVGLLDPILVHVNQHLTNIRLHDFEQISINAQTRSTRLSKQVMARSAIYQHLCQSNLAKNSYEMLFFSKSLFLICRQLHAAESHTSANKAWKLAWRSSHYTHFKQKFLLIAYKLLAPILGYEKLNR